MLCAKNSTYQLPDRVRVVLILERRGGSQLTIDNFLTKEALTTSNSPEVAVARAKALMVDLPHASIHRD